MEIIIDTFGCDDGIVIPIKAACNMINKISEKITLVGKKEDILKCINDEYGKEILEKINILDAEDYITNNEEPAWAIKNKKNSSMVVAYDYMKDHDDTVLISAGSSGALMAGALLKLKRIDGIHRPALLAILPTVNNKKVILLDSGANPQAKDISILQYAMLGEIYSKSILKIENPKIALLNIGEEEEKGTPELKEIYQNLKNTHNNFVGNIEARYIFSGKADVVVCDGLLGNIALKSAEGAVKTVKEALSITFKSSFINKIKGLLVKSTMASALKKYDYKKNGGAVLLGVKKPVIKVHGSSDVITFEMAIMQAKYMLENNIIEKIESKLNDQKNRV